MYFNGFSLKGEQELLDSYIVDNDFTISGFSYGAIKALEYTIKIDKRVDKLQLFSPAYFNDKDKKYKRMQLLYFTKDSKKYCTNFLKNSGFSDLQSKKYFQQGSYDELNELLNYQWTEEKMQNLVDKNIKLEVYLGSNDKIIDPHKALNFFREFGEVYFIKNSSHILSSLSYTIPTLH